MQALSRPRTLLLALALAILPCPMGRADALVEGWPTRLAAARQELLEARERAEAARNTYQDWRQRKYPRGVRKEELVRDVDEAEQAAVHAEERLAAILEQARRDGVPPGVLSDYE